MSATVLKCLVMIKRADLVSPIFVRCILDRFIFLVIPVGDYALPQAAGRNEMRLRAPAHWFLEIANADHQLLCEKIIELDKFDELPWADIPPPAPVTNFSS